MIRRSRSDIEDLALARGDVDGTQDLLSPIELFRRRDNDILGDMDILQGEADLELFLSRGSGKRYNDQQTDVAVGRASPRA